MLDKLTLQDFEKLVGETFSIDFGDAGKLDAKLAEATANKSPSKNRDPFSIVFHCPHPAPAAQGVYPVSHADTGELALFLVPISSNDEGVAYEAVFN